MKKNVCLCVIIFCVTLFNPGCNNEMEESSAETEENPLEELTEGEKTDEEKEEVVEDSLEDPDEKRESEEAMDPPDLTGMKAIFLLANGFHDAETTSPLAYLERHGVECVLVGPEIGEIAAYNTNTTLDIEKLIEDAEITDYDILIIPGGNSPRVLNLNEQALAFVRDFMETKKPVATICRGPYLLAGAGVLEGRTLTAMDFVEDAIFEAGGEFVNEAVFVDRNLITSREPGDLPLFNQAIIEALSTQK